MGREAGREVFFLSSSLSFIFPEGGVLRFTYCTYTDVFFLFSFFFFLFFSPSFQHLSSTTFSLLFIFPIHSPAPLSLISQPKSFDSLSHFFFIFSFFHFCYSYGFGNLKWVVWFGICVCWLVFLQFFFFLLLDWRVWGGLDWNGGEV